MIFSVHINCNTKKTTDTRHDIFPKKTYHTKFSFVKFLYMAAHI